MTEHEKKVLKIVSEAAIYVPAESEGIRISHWDADSNDEDYEGAFWGQGEESGDEIKVYFSEVDLENSMFYKLVLIEV